MNPALLLGPAVRSILGFGQMIKGIGKELRRPTYDVPGSVNQAVSTAQGLASGEMPGKSERKRGIERTASTTASKAASTATDATTVLNTVGMAQTQAGIEKEKLNAQDAQFKADAARNLTRTLGMKSQYEDKAWSWNEGQRYQEDAALKAALIGGGLQNLNTGINDISMLGLANQMGYMNNLGAA